MALFPPIEIERAIISGLGGLDLHLHGFSIALQLLAAALALYTIRLSGGAPAWILLSVAFLLQAMRRGLDYLVAHGFLSMTAYHAWSDVTGLAVSVLILAGVYHMRKVFIARTQAEKALAESEEKFRAIVSGTCDAVMTIDEDGRILSWNPAAERLFGYAAEQALGQPIHELIVPQRFRADAMRGFERFRESGEGPVIGKALELAALRKDGSEFSSQHSISAVRVGGKWHAIGIVRDISERKRIEAELQRHSEHLEELVQSRTAELAESNRSLRENEERLRIILASIAEGLVVTDSEGKVMFMNSEAERLLGWTSAELAGTRLHDRVHCREDGLPAPDEQCEASLAIKNKRSSDEGWFKRRDGTLFPVSVVVAPLIEGELAGTVMAFRDISDLLEAERMKDDMIARVSHELRTPLAGLQGAAELLLRRGLPPEKRKGLLRLIEQDTKRLAQLVGNFVDLHSALGAGPEDYRFQVVEVPPLLEQAVAEASRGDTAHRFRVEADGSLPPARADIESVRRVLANLLSNAIKFSPQGGDITVGAQASGSEITIRVADQGIGIAPEAIPRIFGGLYQQEPADTRCFAGVGLGLPLAKAIVAAHGGRVWVESTPGRGSTFYFTLPVAEG
jgi:PAS domain S-box-containing protein